MEAEQEAEAQRQAEMEAEQEAEAQRQAEMEAEQEAEAQRQAEMEAGQEAEAQRQAEMEAEQEAQAEGGEITVEQSNNEPNSDYKVMIDGEEFYPNYNPLEGSKELIGHSDLDDAYWANDVNSAEKMKEVADKMQAGDYNKFDFAGPMNDMNEIKYESNKNEYEINAFRKVNQWSRDSYTEEYNPEDFN
jgi:multidrug efflux pump subunit AcrA (membrane-fusion protein)